MSRWRPDSIDVRVTARRALFGLRRGGAVERWNCVLAPGESETLDWAGMLDAVGEELKARRVAAGTRLALTVPGGLVRYQVIPWNAAFTAPAARMAFVEQRFVEAYGDSARGWTVRISDGRFGGTAIAAALADADLATLARWEAQNAIRVVSVQPPLMQAFNGVVGRLHLDSFWFALVEDERSTVLFIHNGDPAYIQSAHIRQAELEVLLERGSLVQDADADLFSVYAVNFGPAAALPQTLGRWKLHELRPAVPAGQAVRSRNLTAWQGR